MIDFRVISLLVMGIIIFALGAFVYGHDRKNRINISFGFFVIWVAFWSFSLMLFYGLDDSVLVNFWARVVYFTGGIIPTFFYYFSRRFPHNQNQFGPLKELLLFSPHIGFFILYFFTYFMIESHLVEGNSRGFVYGPLRWLFDIHFILMFFLGFRNLFNKYLQAEGSAKYQLRYVVYGTLIGLILAGITNVILPWFSIFDFLWLGPPFTLVWVVSLSYAIVKHRFMNIRVIATELLIVLILLVLLNEIFLSTSTLVLLLRIGFFLLVTGLSGLLIRSVLLEVKRREEMERLKNELEVAYAKLQEIDQAKTDFLSMASHQLRSPLTVVRLGLGALMDGTFGKLGDPRQKGAMEKMLESTNRLIRLIGDYLNVSRIELGKMKYDFKKQDLCALARDIVEEYVPKAKAKGLTLRYETGNSKLETGRAKGVRLKFETGNLKLETGGLKVVFDEEKLRHVIMNLIDNAIKYTLKGKIEVKCELDNSRIGQLDNSSGLDIGRPDMVHNAPQPPLNLRGGKNGGWVKVTVKDTGMGLTPADIAVLFEKFRRASSAHQRRREGEPIEGSGLGLHVAKMFVDKHGGKIWAVSPGKGKGSTFYFTLPVSGPPELPPEELGEGGKGVELPI